MYIGEKLVLKPRSFHHRIREGGGHYIDQEQFMGIDPFDKSKFHQVHEPPVNVRETKDTYLLELMVPGFQKDEITIQVDHNELVISGQKSTADMMDNAQYVYGEQIMLAFERRIDLGPGVAIEQIEAEMDQGVLHLRMIKSSHPENRKEIPVH